MCVRAHDDLLLNLVTLIASVSAVRSLWMFSTEYSVVPVLNPLRMIRSHYELTIQVVQLCQSRYLHSEDVNFKNAAGKY